MVRAALIQMCSGDDPEANLPETERLARWFEDQGADGSLALHDGGHEIRQDELAAIQRFLA